METQYAMNARDKKVLIVKPEDNYFFPIGYSYLLAAWDQEGIAYDYVDMHLYPNHDIETMLRSNNYYCVCAGGLIWSLPFFKKIFDVVKRVNQNIACVLGGNITQDFSAKELFAYTAVDYLVIGEGEITSTKLLKHIQDSGISPTPIRGVSYRSRDDLNGFVTNKRRPPLDLTANNWQPTWKFLETKKYTYVNKLRKNFFPVITGRGCTGRCAFCSPTNGRYRERPIPFIMEEIEYLMSNYEFDYFDFLNEVFFQNEDHVREFCGQYSKLTGNKPWRCLQRVDTSPSVLNIMKDAGCFTVNIGLESGSDRILKAIKKNITTDQAKSFIAALKQAGIKIDATFMFGNYDETPQDMAMTIDFLLEQRVLGPMALCITYPGTLNYLRARNRGLIDADLPYALSIHDAYNSNYLQHMEAYYTGKRHYINITAMPDDILFETVANEMRRLHEFGCRYRNVTASTDDGHTYTLRGNCPVCDAENEKTVYVDDYLSFMEHQCSNCYEEYAYFSFLDIPETHSAYSRSIDSLRGCRTIVFAGSRTQLYFAIRNGLPGLDFKTVSGFILTKHGDPLPDDTAYIGNVRRMPLADLTDNHVDAIVALGANSEEAAANIGLPEACGDGKTSWKSVSLFPQGRLGHEVRFASLPQGKVLVVTSAQQNVVDSLLNDLQTLGCSVSLLVQGNKADAYASVTERHICSTDFFDHQALSSLQKKKLKAEHFEFAIFPFSIDIGTYRNVLECLASIGVKQVFGYHANNSEADFQSKLVVTAPYYAYMNALA